MTEKYVNYNFQDKDVKIDRSLAYRKVITTVDTRIPPTRWPYTLDKVEEDERGKPIGRQIKFKDKTYPVFAAHTTICLGGDWYFMVDEETIWIKIK